jgi:hypothetical protein
MDMREMVDKAKKGEPLYGYSVLSPYMQGVAARNSRYSQLFIHVIPWVNVVNHNQVHTCYHISYFLKFGSTNIMTIYSTESIQLSTIGRQSWSWKLSARNKRGCLKLQC